MGRGWEEKEEGRGRGREVERREKGGERAKREGRREGGGRETHMLTMKGCRIEARMDFSLLTCSTCLSRITSEMVIILSAKNCLVGMSRASTTRPNVPVPECVGGVEGVWRGCGWRVYVGEGVCGVEGVSAGMVWWRRVTRA